MRYRDAMRCRDAMHGVSTPDKIYPPAIYQDC